MNYSDWPDEVGKGFKQTLETVFLNTQPNDQFNEFGLFWSQIENFRHDVIGRLKPDPDDGSIRRGRLYVELNNFLPGLERKEKIHDVREIWTNINDLNQRRIVQRFLKWVDYSYHLNQSSLFKLNSSLLSMNSIDFEFSHHLGLQKNITSFADHKFACFEIPSVDDLLNIKPEILFEAREHESGNNYFVALNAYKENPSRETAGNFIESLRLYSIHLKYVRSIHGGTVLNPETQLRVKVSEGVSKLIGVGILAADCLTPETSVFKPVIHSINFTELLCAGASCGLFYSEKYLPPFVNEVLFKNIGIGIEPQTITADEIMAKYQTPENLRGETDTFYK